MTTWWRPDLERIRAEIAAEAELELKVKVEASEEDDGLGDSDSDSDDETIGDITATAAEFEVKVEASDDDGANKGAKRKRAPPTRGGRGGNPNEFVFPPRLERKLTTTPGLHHRRPFVRRRQHRSWDSGPHAAHAGRVVRHQGP